MLRLPMIARPAFKGHHIRSASGSFGIVIVQVCACVKICLSKNVLLQACGRLSEGSSRATQFYELEVQVKGATFLEESLVGANHLLLQPRGFHIY